MEYQSTQQTLKSCLTRIQKGEAANRLTDAQKAVVKQQKRDLNDCIDLVKRVKMYGGIETLLQQAAKAQAGETLFADLNPANG